MATLVLSAAGMAIGGSIGGAVAGVSAATIGRAAGASLGRVIDQRVLGSGSKAVESGRVDRFKLTGASEGAAIGQVYGRMRIGGQIIWATKFLESASTTGGGKGTQRQPKTTTFAYSVSLAVALCEGEISSIGRIWADGDEVSKSSLNLRLYPGSQDQLPDPKISAVEGPDLAPAFRGTAYVVFEDLALEQFGNRVPQFTFEVIRPDLRDGIEEPQDLASFVEAVALLPGSGEFALATTPVYFDKGFGNTRAANVNTAAGKSDLEVSLDTLVEELPKCSSTSLVVSWFGDDLRCGACTLQPLVEQKEVEGSGMAWSVSGQDRSAAGMVPREDGRPLYGGTPADASVVEAIAAAGARGQSVMFYPFILMTQTVGNALPNPYAPDEEQPVFPWRGRITTSVAAGVDGTTDMTQTAADEVAAFFGQASVADFVISGTSVSYTGPSEASYRRFILHYAHLCAAAGGVDAFCIGSEMRGLTQIRDQNGEFVAVEALRALAADVRAILGPETKISYAADWSEYFGHHPQDDSGDLYYHLDPLWADPNIDFIGIDNYMPLSDWRDGLDHADAQAGSIYALDYLEPNVAGGEGFDWYYHSDEARAAQIRTPIEDAMYAAPWEFRYKDLKSWWENQHINRMGGVREAAPTAWEPQSKPIWFTELGCAAIDKGTNQPNKFLDPKSSESQLPHYSNGQRDDLIQLQFLRAHATHWSKTENNPTSVLYDGAMVDMSRAHIWAWDARPFPAFPRNSEVWSDGENYLRGHWITGRTGNRTLASVVSEICERSGVLAYDVSNLHRLVRGFEVNEVGTGRAALQPLMLAFGFDAVERDGVLKFFNRTAVSGLEVEQGMLVYEGADNPTLELVRAPEAEIVGRHQLTFEDIEQDYQAASEGSVFADEEAETIGVTDLPIALTRAEAKRITERWLGEARLAKDHAQFALPPSLSEVGAGDTVTVVTDEGRSADFRIDRVEVGTARAIEAIRVDKAIYDQTEVYTDLGDPVRFVPPTPVFPVFLDLPLLTGNEVEHAPHLAVTAQDWPGSVSVYSSLTQDGFELNSVITNAATLGRVESDVPSADPARLDRQSVIRIALTHGSLESVSLEAMLGGANLAAIGDPETGNWEIIQFQIANLVDAATYDISVLLRGQKGTDAIMPDLLPAGATFVLLDSTVSQIELAPGNRDMSLNFLIGPSGRSYDDPIYVAKSEAFAGNGLKPYAPVHLRKSNMGQDHQFTWVRRTRIDGDAWANLDVPLGEAQEGYLVRVLQGSTLVREIQVDTPTWTYSQAERDEDTGGLDYKVSVAQISDRFGYGDFRTVSVSV